MSNLVFNLSFIGLELDFPNGQELLRTVYKLLVWNFILEGLEIL